MRLIRHPRFVMVQPAQENRLPPRSPTAPKPDAPARAARPDMPAEPTQAGRFEQARRVQSMALLEDYAELIADLHATGGEARATDIARRLGVTHATAIKAITRLKREGLATARPYRGVFLTEEGERLAARVKTRHRLVVDVLRAIGVPAEAAEQDAEGIEHHVSDITLAAFARFLKERK
jgi:DtxR family manganese transport transcriptional regulator